MSAIKHMRVLEGLGITRRHCLPCLAGKTHTNTHMPVRKKYFPARSKTHQSSTLTKYW